MILRIAGKAREKSNDDRNENFLSEPFCAELGFN